MNILAVHSASCARILMPYQEFKLGHRKFANSSHPASVGCRQRGYTLVEVMMAALVGTILTAVAIPQVRPAVNNYRLRGAVASATWAIQSTRYQALT